MAINLYVNLYVIYVYIDEHIYILYVYVLTYTLCRQMVEMIQDKLVLARGLRTPEVPCAAAACYRTFECGATFRTSEARFMTSGCRAAFLKA